MTQTVYPNRQVGAVVYAAAEITVVKRKSKGCRAFVISEQNLEHINCDVEIYVY
ncbi:hypothetical protein [Porcincola intestinalis]|uniref:hypothetical protein n=1 Tax=Porcincola intestinalis TaxID=2606632 RepID=UPI002A90AFD4|nr:hypothetical protein [Porcincola intestinalis]MDY5578721.1 hypothetical protein [Porcincola intestinalis]